MAYPLAIAAFGVAAAVGAYDGGPFPNMPTFPQKPRIEQLYKDGDKVVGRPVLNPDSADQACPNGFEIARQGTREDGAKYYLVWDLRCR
jgi:hypothetical protein